MAVQPPTPPLRRRLFLQGLSVPLLGLAGLGLGSLPSRALAAVPERALLMHQPHTGETVRTVYFAESRYQEEGLRTLSRFLRDWRTDEVIPVDPGVLDILYVLQGDLETAGPIEVLCGYRSPETNAMLRRQSSAVAKNSLHMVGQAVDLRFPGRDLATLHRAALALEAGGVGYYPVSGFVHLDSGPVRHWQEVAASGGGSRRSRARAAKRASLKRKTTRRS